MQIRLLIDDRIYDAPSDLQQEIASMLQLYSDRDAKDEQHLHRVGLRRVFIDTRKQRLPQRDLTH